jgi:hypothetical protein
MFEDGSEPGRLVHPRLEAQRSAQAAWRAKSAIGGHKSAEIRKGGSTTLARVVEPPYQPKGNTPTPSPSPIKEVPAIAGEHRAFIEGWCQNYKSAWNVDYKMDGSRDGKAVKELLNMGILRLDLLEIAKQAWSSKPQTFETKQACTIHGFRAYFNQLNLFARSGGALHRKTQKEIDAETLAEAQQ